MDEQRQQLIDRIKQAQNILVTVSANPSVDQLAAAIGLTIALNKLDKHGTAVFSGQVPSTMEFLKPADTLEKNTDSLRDFIIALDKSKADKLRYKVEDQVVRIFITPYKTSLSQADLNFSQGDFNVDVVVCLGVSDQQDLDTAITAHGRILHDATVVSVSNKGQGNLGTINWVDPTASSLSEMMVGLVDGLDRQIIDNQIATALLTGIVASTERFSNDKTSPKTMSASAELMAAGANQQLIATELEAPGAPASSQSSGADTNGSGAEPVDQPAKKVEPGTLEIDHEAAKAAQAAGTDQPPVEEPEEEEPQIQVDAEGHLVTADEADAPKISRVRGVGSDGKPADSAAPEVKRERMVEPPHTGTGDLTANSSPEKLDPPTEELALPAADSPLLRHNESVLKPAADAADDIPAPPPPQTPVFTPPPLPPAPEPWQPPQPAATPSDDTTLTDIEASVDSPHLHTSVPADDGATTVDDARNAVEAALNGSNGPVTDPLQPIAALNAQPLGPELHNDPIAPPAAASTPAQFVPAPGVNVPPPMPTASTVTNAGFSEPTPGSSPADAALDMPLPSNPFGPGQQASTEQFQSPQSFTMPPAQQTPPSTFPGAAPQQGSGQAPPPVPPPMLPPLQ